jgi:hypothetical protein
MQCMLMHSLSNLWMQLISLLLISLPSTQQEGTHNSQTWTWLRIEDPIPWISDTVSLHQNETYTLLGDSSLKKDPSKKALRASEEVTSITGITVRYELESLDHDSTSSIIHPNSTKIIIQSKCNRKQKKRIKQINEKENYSNE